jgi:hypothetical protein
MEETDLACKQQYMYGRDMMTTCVKQQCNVYLSAHVRKDRRSGIDDFHINGRFNAIVKVFIKCEDNH